MGQNWLGADFCIVREIRIIFILAKGSRKNKYETEIANGLKRKHIYFLVLFDRKLLPLLP